MEIISLQEIPGEPVGAFASSGLAKTGRHNMAIDISRLLCFVSESFASLRRVSFLRHQTCAALYPRVVFFLSKINLSAEMQEGKAVGEFLMSTAPKFLIDTPTFDQLHLHEMKKDLLGYCVLTLNYNLPYCYNEAHVAYGKDH